MKQFLSKLKELLNTSITKDKNLVLINEITFLSENNLSISEIELFLDIKLTDFNKEYFNKYFSEYVNLINHLNTIQLIQYINFNEQFKKETLTLVFKKLFYPLFLIVFAFLTLTLFKFSLIQLFEDTLSNTLLVFINSIYFTSLTLIIFIILVALFILFTFRNTTYFLLIYHRIYKFRVLKPIELYFLNILTHLLLSFYKEGLSTKSTFELINQFKGNSVISNIAYFLNSDLEAGSSISDSIKNMKTTDEFKRVLLFAIKSNNFESLIGKYALKINEDLIRELNYLANVFSFLAYLYIGVVIVLLYKIISLPLSLIETL